MDTSLVITWLISIVAITLSIVAVIVNFSRKGPQGEKGERGAQGIPGEVQQSAIDDLQRELEDKIEEIKEEIEDLEANLQSGSFVVKNADHLYNEQTTSYTPAGQLSVANADNADNATKLNDIVANDYVTTLDNLILKLNYNTNDRQILGMIDNAGYGGDSNNNRYAVFHNYSSPSNDKYHREFKLIKQ